MNKVSIIYPTFNEKDSAERNLKQIYKNFSKIQLQPEVVIVDDSKDGSEILFEKLKNKYKNMTFIHRTNEKGVGSAIRLGIEKSKGEYVIVSMFDSPQEIMYFPEIIKKLDAGYDLVHTSRFIGGAKMVGYPFKKLVANRLCNNLASILFLRPDLKDFTSLFKGFRRDKILALDLKSNEFSLALEMTTKAIRKKYKIIETPVDWIERDIGQSKLILKKQVPIYFKTLFNVWLNYR
jgi:dolichol-phosphate mannosyltransferase